MNIVKNRNNVITYAVNKAVNNNLYISIHDGEVIVKAPWYLSKEQIQDAVEEKKQWIISKLKEYENKSKTKEEYAKSKSVLILGENYNLKVNYKNIKTTELNVDHKNIKIILPNKYKKINNSEILKILIDKMYHTIAEQEIEYVMEKTRIMLGFAPEDYKIERMKNILGKCSVDKEITINPDIVKYKKELIEYIVLHEFCHLKYKNHSKGFYKMIETYMPNYKKYADVISNFQY